MAFVPSESPKLARSGFRRIEVKVARRRLDLRYRHGYWRESAQHRTDRDLVLVTRLPDLFSNAQKLVVP